MKQLFTLLFIAILAIPAIAQTNFSGTWKLNKSKSTLNQEFSFAPSEIILTQTATDIKIEKLSNFQGSDFKSTDNVTLDGKECINEGFMDSKKKVTAKWEGNNLVLTSKIAMQDGNELTLIETLQLVDGSLILNSVTKSSFGDMNEKMAYDKL